MKQSSNKNQIKSVCIGLIMGVLWFAIYWLLLWKIPFYAHINKLKLPGESESVITKVCIIDEGTWLHVVAEKVFISNLQEDFVLNYIARENDIQINCGKEYIASTYISNLQGEHPDYIIRADGRWYRELDEEERYFMVLYSSLYNDKVLRVVAYMSVVTTVFVIVITSLLILRKYNRTADM